MPVQPLSTPSAPPAVGPYSPAVRAGDWITCSGQIPLDPATGDLVAGGIDEQTTQAVANCAAVLRDVGAEPGDVAKTTVFLTDMANFPAMNGIYATLFGDHKPARSTVAVVALPKGALVEIEMLVYRPS
jgi:2-iminobutanoate/2-iminopropanoate deaminase